ncbi:MAG: aminotransferase class III-fold pyridoxal phosphate-dependent enzyme [Candidatus Bathyarchaeia archaeon]
MCNIGHGVEEVEEAVKRQMDDLRYVHSGHFITRSVKYCASKLSNFARKGLNHVFFCSGRSEATEAAAKVAR